MKVVKFKIPKTQEDIYHFQKDRLGHFYDKLHQHPEVQITCIEKSNGTLIAGDYIGNFNRGDVFIIGSSLAHVFRNYPEYYLHSRKDQAVGLSLYVDTQMWRDSFWATRESLLVGKFIESIYSAFKVEGKLREIIQVELRRLITINGFKRILCVLNILYQVYKNKKDLHLISGEGSWQSLKDNDGMRMNDIIRFTLEENYRTISLDEVAKIANMTTEAFCRYFKIHTRKTYISFLNEIRIQNACKLLSDGNLNKSEIAYRTGFNNLSYFNRTFKNITGKTPGEYALLLK